MYKSIIALALSFGLLAQAEVVAPKNKNTKKQKSDQIALAPIASSIESDVPAMQKEPNMHIRIAPTAAVIFSPIGSTTTGSVAGFGGEVGMTFNTNQHLELGFETGFVHFANGTDPLTAVPLMFTMIYKMGSGTVKPYIGFSAGFYMIKGTESRYSSQENDYVDSEVILPIPTVAFRPGIDISLARSVSLFVEAKAGTVLSAPYIQPQLGVSLNF